MQISELFKKEIHAEVTRQLTTITVRKTGDTPLQQFDLVNKKYVDGKVTGGVTGSVTLAKLTLTGTTGYISFTKGIITAYQSPT